MTRLGRRGLADRLGHRLSAGRGGDRRQGRLRRRAERRRRHGRTTRSASPATTARWRRPRSPSRPPAPACSTSSACRRAWSTARSPTWSPRPRGEGRRQLQDRRRRRLAVTITIQATDTMASLARKDRPGDRLPGQRQPRTAAARPAAADRAADPCATVTLSDGPAGIDALAALGLKAGVIDDHHQEGATTSRRTARRRSIGLGSQPTLDLGSAADIQTARSSSPARCRWSRTPTRR